MYNYGLGFRVKPEITFQMDLLVLFRDLLAAVGRSLSPAGLGVWGLGFRLYRVGFSDRKPGRGEKERERERVYSSLFGVYGLGELLPGELWCLVEKARLL